MLTKKSLSKFLLTPKGLQLFQFAMTLFILLGEQPPRG